MTATSSPSRWRVGLILTIGVLSVSTAAVFIRLALAAIDQPTVGFSLVLAASRLTLAAAFLLPTWRQFPPNLRQSPALPYSIGAGLFLALHFATWITSLSYTSIAASATLVTTSPIWVALLSWLWFKEKPSWLTAIGIAVTLAGGSLVGLSSLGAQLGSNPVLGNALALIGAWAVTLYFLLGREAQRQGLNIGTHIAITYTTAAIVLLPLPLLFGASYGGYPPTVYVCIVLMALFPQLIGHSSFNWAVRWVSPTLVTLTILAEPIGASALGFLIFRENPGIWVVWGAIVILAGVAIAAIGSAQTSK